MILKRYAQKKLTESLGENFGDTPKEELLEVIGDVLAVKRIMGNKGKGDGKGKSEGSVTLADQQME